MKTASVILILALCITPAVAQQQSDPIPTGVGVPKEYTPTYSCVVGYLEGIAHRHLLGNHFHRTLDQLGIPHDSPLKDRLTQFTLQVIELNNKTFDMTLTETNKAAWVEAKYDFLENRIRTTKTWYDSFLDAVKDEGLDADEVHETMVEEGRKIISINLVGSTAFSEKFRSIFRIFEPETTNPWLRQVD